MMKPEFAAFIHRLCLHFDRKDPIPERMDTLFKAVAEMNTDTQRLEAMHGWLVSTFDELPKNLSKAIWDSYAATRTPSKDCTPDGNGGVCTECHGDRMISYVNANGYAYATPCGRCCFENPYAITKVNLVKLGFRVLD